MFIQIDNDSSIINGTVRSNLVTVKEYPVGYTIQSINLTFVSEPEGTGTAEITDGGVGFNYWNVMFSMVQNTSMTFEIYVVTQHEVSENTGDEQVTHDVDISISSPEGVQVTVIFP
ncbi:hypothetical protein L9F63_008031 [Diploptera punctata]|uniref:Uncharacterized protein n=1 Tax=Diploptera punctata TaxID=6984 RepID=A0AAD7Z6L4_DIPPU|nr:hypothetical protein L9F63_008031 [Diploptera punctata]